MNYLLVARACNLAFRHRLVGEPDNLAGVSDIDRIEDSLIRFAFIFPIDNNYILLVTDRKGIVINPVPALGCITCT